MRLTVLGWYEEHVDEAHSEVDEAAIDIEVILGTLDCEDAIGPILGDEDGVFALAGQMVWTS